MLVERQDVPTFDKGGSVALAVGDHQLFVARCGFHSLASNAGDTRTAPPVRQDIDQWAALAPSSAPA